MMSSIFCLHPPCRHAMPLLEQYRLWLIFVHILLREFIYLLLLLQNCTMMSTSVCLQLKIKMITLHSQAGLIIRNIIICIYACVYCGVIKGRSLFLSHISYLLLCVCVKFLLSDSPYVSSVIMCNGNISLKDILQDASDNNDKISLCIWWVT